MPALPDPPAPSFPCPPGACLRALAVLIPSPSEAWPPLALAFGIPPAVSVGGNATYYCMQQVSKTHSMRHSNLGNVLRRGRHLHDADG